MKWRFRDEGLETLWADPEADGGYPPGVVKAFRKAMQRIDSAVTTKDFGGRFEKLKGSRSHQYSMRLNNRWRLILEFEGEAHGFTAVVVEIADYH